MASGAILVERGAPGGAADSLPPGAVLVTINRPDALNSLTRPMLEQLAQTFKSLRADKSARVVILTGAGRAFSAGIDLTAAQSVFQGDVKDIEADPVAQMELCPLPIIGAINGHAVTAGFEIALACDILIASREAKFMDTHTKFGLMPSWGLSQKLPRLIGANRAREVSFTALPLDAPTAAQWGLISRAVEPGQLLPEAKRLAGAIIKNQSGLVSRYKSVLNDGLKVPLGEALKLEKERAHAYYSQMKPEEFKAMQSFVAGRSRKGGSQKSKL
eukprot:TRINITY_DN18876_c0_g1_i1.p1 TRINITY_DN18876_c0_g1~~TRINITY_DN18876_c0_g1_i1.p1  ORF type:complete len:273 (-),score=58.48 TRINITY_DN18876_c0_g1_i1:388-1206(-)